MAAGFQRREYFNPSAVDTGQAQVFGTIADRLREFSQRQQQVVDEGTIGRAAAAGAEAAKGGNGKLKAEWNAANRAYNEGLVRASAMDTYADAEVNIARLEAEAGTDPEKFRTAVEGYRNGVLPNVMGRAQPIVMEAIQKREVEGLTRIGRLKAAEDKANAQAQSERGRKAMSDAISRYLTSTDPQEQVHGQSLMQTYVDTVHADVDAGLLTDREGVASIDQMYKRAGQQVVIGQLEGELDNPSGKPMQVIEQVMKTDSALMSDDDKMKFVGELINRVQLHQRVQLEAAQQETADLKGRWAAGEKQATDLLLKGQLTIGTLQRMVENDDLDPGVARTLRNELSSGAAKTDDDAEEFNVRTNLLDFTEAEIAGNQRLTYATRMDLINDRRKQVAGWQDTNPLQEGRRRIDAELGIVPGSMQSLSEEKGRTRGRAMTEYYNRMQAIPEAERDAKAIEVSEAVIKDVLRGRAAADLKTYQQRLASRKADLEKASGKRERETIQGDIDRITSRIADLQKRAEQ